MSGDGEVVKIGAEFHVVPEAAERFRAAFHDLVGELLEDFNDGEVIDYGVD
jgi:hypothetical protein